MSAHSKVATLRPPTAQVAADGPIIGTVDNGGAIANTDVYNEALFVLDVTAVTPADAADILDVFLDISPDRGNTWINAVRFVRIIGTDAAAKHVARLEFDGGTSLDTIDVTANILDADVAAGGTGKVRAIGIGTMIRYQGIVTDADADASFTYSLQVFLK